MFRLLAAVLLTAFLTVGLPATPQSLPSDLPSPTGSAGILASASKSISTGHPEDALKQLDQLAALNPEPAGVERLRGFAYYQAKNIAAAEAAFGNAVSQDPSDKESMQMLGVVLYSLGRPADALPFLEKARVAVPSVNVDPNYMLGMCYLALRRYDEARRALAAQYDLSGDSAPAYLLMARIFLRQENPTAAVDSARKALALQPDLPLAHLLLGQVALAQARLPEAIMELNRERELNPLNGDAYEQLGDAYLRSGDRTLAQQVLSRAVLLEPDASGPYILLGKLMLDRNDNLLASLYLERAVNIDSGNSTAHSLLAEAYRRTGRADAANKETQAADQLRSGKAKPSLNTVH